MTEDTRRHSGGGSPHDFDGVNSFSSGFGEPFRTGRGASSPSDPWGLGSAARTHDASASRSQNGSGFHSLRVRFPPVLDKGYAPFDLAPATLRDPSPAPRPGAPVIRAGDPAPALKKDVPAALWLCRAGALCLHGALVALLLYEPASDDYGSSHVQSTAISVNMTTTQVMDSIEEKANDQGAPAEVPLAQNTPEPEPVPEETPEPPKPDENLVLASQNSDTPLLTPEPVKPPEEKKEEEKEKKVEQKAPKPLPQNVATSSGVSAANGSQGRVTAAYGDMLHYKASVHARIARNRPQGVESHGVTKLKFEISETGHLLNCQVIDSSGSSTLDNAALRAIRKASPFSPPPGGHPMTFIIPFKFY